MLKRGGNSSVTAPQHTLLNDAQVTRATKVKFNKHVICQHNVTAIKTRSLTGDKSDLPALHRHNHNIENETLCKTTNKSDKAQQHLCRVYTFSRPKSVEDFLLETEASL